MLLNSIFTLLSDVLLLPYQNMIDIQASRRQIFRICTIISRKSDHGEKSSSGSTSIVTIGVAQQFHHANPSALTIQFS